MLLEAIFFFFFLSIHEISLYFTYTGPWERFLPKGGPHDKKNEILPILKIFTL